MKEVSLQEWEEGNAFPVSISSRAQEAPFVFSPTEQRFVGTKRDACVANIW